MVKNKGKDKGKIIKATQTHIDKMKGNLRESDKQQLWASTRMGPDEGLQRAFDISKFCWVGVLNNKPILCFGVSAFSLLSSKGSPWLLATDDIKKAKVKFIKGCRKCVRKMLSFFDRLENTVDVRNEVSIRWLKWCGFTIGESISYGPNRLMFYKFWLNKGFD